MSGASRWRSLVIACSLLSVAVATAGWLAPLALPEPEALRRAWFAIAIGAALLAAGGLAFLLRLAAHRRRRLEAPPLSRSPQPAIDFDSPWKGGGA